MNIKVTVIVPAYNVEKYIEKCIDSIMQQTYKNLEIIVVDDGSKDRTGIILDGIQLTDQRVKVIHQQNGGVSSARNAGLNEATGDYVVFVDGDDYLAADFVEYMLGLAKETRSEFCIARNFITKEGEEQNEEKLQLLSNAEGTALLLSPDMIVGCHNKMYLRDTIEKHKLRFSTELFYGEGLFFITTFSQLANSVAVGNRKVYFYRKDNQNSATTKFSIENLRNGWKSLSFIERDLKIKSQQVDTMLLLHKCNFSAGAIVRIRATGVKDAYYEDYKYWKNYLCANTLKLMLEKKVSIYRKLLLLCGCISPALLTELDILRRKQIVKNSVRD